jgi:aspartyl/asparaginyl beta-hydroxylase (cupin superfamily)
MVEQPVRGWMDPAAYPFCAFLESNYLAILEELEQLLTQRVWTVWKEGPYTPSSTDATYVNEGGEPHWRLFGLYLKGRPIEPHCRSCPRTARLLSQVPDLSKAGFSCLEAGYQMQPHIGHDPRNYRIHLGLIIPEGDCGMRVQGESRQWQVGKVTMFDDNQIHDAWNRTAANRFVLLVDVANRPLV